MSPLNEGGARSRTRNAILDAAMSVLADNPTASLGDIAAAAEVGPQHAAPLLRRAHRPAACPRPSRPRPEQRGDRTRGTRLRSRRSRRCAGSSSANSTSDRSCRSSTTSRRSPPTPNWRRYLDTGDEVIVEVLEPGVDAGFGRATRLATAGVLGAAERRLRGRQAQQRPSRPDRRRDHGQPHRRHHQPESAMTRPTFTTTSVSRSSHVQPARRRADARQHTAAGVVRARRPDVAGAVDRRSTTPCSPSPCR